MNNSVIIEEITKRIEMRKEFFEKLVSQKKYLLSQLTNWKTMDEVCRGDTNRNLEE